MIYSRKALQYFVLVSALLCTACVATPDRDFVPSKTGDSWTPIEGCAAYEPESFPRSVKQDIPLENINITLRLNASVSLPKVSAIPVYRVAGTDFSQTCIDALLASLYGQAPLYVQQSPHEVTKAQYMKQIMDVKNKLQMETEAAAIANLEQTLDYLEEQYKNAPTHYTPKQSDGKIWTRDKYIAGKTVGSETGVWLTDGAPGNEKSYFTLFQNANLTKPITVVDMTPETAGVQLPVYTGAMLTYTKNIYGSTVKQIDDAIYYAEENINSKIFPPSKALTIGQDFWDSAQVKEMTPFSKIYLLTDENDNFAYRILYAPSYANISSIQFNFMDKAGVEEESFTKSWYFECAELIVNNDGVQSLSWISPHEKVETLTENVALLPFSQILEKLKAYIKYAYSPYVMTEGNHLEVLIDAIDLGYMRVLEKDSIKYGILVPAWAFYGTIKYYHSAEEVAQGYPEIEEIGKDMVYIPIIINGVNGSRIDPNMGY